MNKLRKFLSSIGPGIFIIGYVVGTGSVTTMASSGAKYGMSMTWALALSCFFTYILIVNISRLTILSGETLIHLIRSRFGNLAAIVIIIGLMITVISSVIGVTAIAADVFQEWTRMLSPGGQGLHPALSALFIISILYYLFWFGKHGVFLRFMSVIVALMGVSFIGSMFMVIPSASDIIKGMVPQIPEGSGSHLHFLTLHGLHSLCGIVRISI